MNHYFERFLEKMRIKEQRKLLWTILGGKALGLLFLLILISGISVFIFGSKGFAQNAPVTAAGAAATTAAAPATPPTPEYVNPINTMWTLVAAFLVFFMQAGFMFLEAGFARTRETVNVLLEGIVDTCLCGLLFYAWGLGFMFASGNGFIGHQWFFLQGTPDTYQTTGVAFLAYFLFQYAFADTCSTITSGAMVGRTGFVGDLLYSFGVSGF